MSDPGDQPTLPPGSQEGPTEFPPAPPPRGHTHQSEPPGAPAPESSPSKLIADDHPVQGQSQSESRAGWGDAGTSSAADVPFSPAPGPTPPTEPLLIRECASCHAAFAGREHDRYCPSCRLLHGDASDSGAESQEPFEVTGRVCLSCGYNLTGLRSDGACPECGTPVARSLKGNLLRFSSLQYVQTLHLGIILAEVGAIAGIASVLLGTGIQFGAKAVGMSTHAADFLRSGLGLLVSGLSIIGWWMFSTPDTGSLGEDSAVGARKLLRISLIVEVVLSLGRFVATFLLPPGAAVAIAGSHAVMGLAFFAAGLIVWILRFFTSLFYMRTVALRIPDVKLYERAGRFMWLGPLLSVVLCVIGMIASYVIYIVMLERARALLRGTRDYIRDTPAPN